MANTTEQREERLLGDQIIDKMMVKNMGAGASPVTITFVNPLIVT